MFFKPSLEILTNSAALTLSKLRRQTSSCSGLEQCLGGSVLGSGALERVSARNISLPFTP